MQAATEAVHRALPQADVVIHTVPREARAESIFDRVRAVAARNNVSVHELSVQSHHGRLRVEQHVELDENMPLLEAHELCDRDGSGDSARDAGDRLRADPHRERAGHHRAAGGDGRGRSQNRAGAARRGRACFAEIADVHEITVGRSGEHIHLSCHCTLPDDLTMQRVHEVITALEDRFKLECPEVYRVTIHPEPVTDNLR